MLMITPQHRQSSPLQAHLVLETGPRSGSSCIRQDCGRQAGTTRARLFLMLREWNTHAILMAWVLLICCVVAGSLLPAASPTIVALGRFHISDKMLHFCAYLALSSMPVIGFRDHQIGIVAGLLMFMLGVLLEVGQHFSPGRTVELGDVVANGAGVICGVLLAQPIRTVVAIRP